MAGPNLPTNRTTASTTAEHVADHNLSHSVLNALEAVSGVPLDLGWKVAEDYSLDTTGATTHTAAQVQAWLDAGRAYAAGTITCSGSVTINEECDLSKLTWNYTGTGTAIQVGTAAVLFRKTIRLPLVVATAKTQVGWAQVAGSVGVRLVNLNTCTVWAPRIGSFETGLSVVGQGQGNAYNTIFVGHLDNNKINCHVTADATGWSNDNKYIGGRYAHNSAEGNQVTGVRHIQIVTAPSTPNNNLWIGASLEANMAEYHLEAAGGENRWITCRWENGATGCRVWWRSGVFRSTIDGGYAAHQITETYEAGSAGQTVLSGQGWRMRQSAGTGGLLRLENATGNTTPVLTAMAAGAAVAGSNPDTEYVGRWTPNLLAFKRATDTFDRFQIDPVNGRLYFGNAAAAPVMYWAPVSTTGVGLYGASLYFGTDNTQDVGLITSLRPRYVRAGTATVTGAFATGSRPTAATAGVGAHYFDTTLNKPVWSDGTAWRDATGTVV